MINTINTINYDACKLEDIKIKKEFGKYYLALKYIVEDKTEKFELSIPRVELPIPNYDCKIDIFKIPNVFISNEYSYKLVLSDGAYLNIYEDDNGNIFTKTILETKTRKMTIDEIEKELGYKVEIVGSKGGK